MTPERIRQITAERDAALAWKKEATTVIDSISLQEVGKALNVPLGGCISSAILPGIQDLTARAELAEKALAQLCRIVHMRYDGCLGVDASDPTIVWGMLWEDGREVVWHESETPELAAYLKEKDRR